MRVCKHGCDVRCFAFRANHANTNLKNQPLSCLYQAMQTKVFYCLISLQFIFFPEQPFYGYYSTLDSHTNTVISNEFACSSRWRRKP